MFFFMVQATRLSLCFPGCHRNFMELQKKQRINHLRAMFSCPIYRSIWKWWCAKTWEFWDRFCDYVCCFVQLGTWLFQLDVSVDGFQIMPAWRNGYFTNHQTGVIISNFWGDQTIDHCFVRISPSTLHYSGNVMTPVIVKRKQNRFLRISVLVILLAASSCHQQTATGWCHPDRIRCGDSWWFRRLLFTPKIFGRFPSWRCSYAFRLVVQPGMRVPWNLGDSETIGFLDNEPFL